MGTEFAVNPDGTVKWSFAGVGHAPTSAAIGADGTIYYGSGSTGSGDVDATLFALNPDGTLKWTYEEDAGYLRTPPAIGKGQRLYAGTVEGFFAIGPS